MSATITITGLDAVIKRFNLDLMVVVRPAALVIGEEVRNKIAVEPTTIHRPIIWASLKQKRWWFAHRAEKGYPPGYTRNTDPESQQLSKSWTVQPTATGAVVGTRGVTYAPWVQSATKTEFGGPQTAQHRATGWVTDEQVINNPEIERMAIEAVTRAITAALRG